MEEPASHLQHRLAIFGHHLVGRQQREAFHASLGDQDAVERILVMQWKFAGNQRMLAAYREFLIAIHEQQAPEPAGIDLEVIPTEAALDADFPQAGGAEQQTVGGIENQPARFS